MRKLFCLLFLLLSCSLVFADFKIEQKDRVKNYPSGCCLWSSIENLGKYHGIDRMSGLAKRRHDRSEELVESIHYIFVNGSFIRQVVWEKRGDAPGTEDRAHEELRSLKVKYRLQSTGNLDTKILEDNKDLGCAIGIRDFPREGDMHAVTLTHFDDKICRFIDNNGNCDKYEVTREWFDRHWTGLAIVIYPDK